MVWKSLFVLMVNYLRWPRRSEDQAKVVVSNRELVRLLLEVFWRPSRRECIALFSLRQHRPCPENGWLN